MTQLFAEHKTDTFNEHRSALLGLAYRMLGSVMDAEDIVQEAFIHWQNASTERIEAPKTYLMTVVARLCIDYLRLARVKREQYVGEWLPEPLLQSLEPDPAVTMELAESLSTAFLVMLEKLNPLSRVILLLHEVFGYTFEEIAPIVGRTSADCRQIGHRARTNLSLDKPHPVVDRAKAEALAHRFMRACNEGDMSAILSVMAKDVILYSDGGGKANAARKPIFGAERVARLFYGIHRKATVTTTRRLYQFNGQVAVVSLRGDEPIRIDTFEFDGDKIKMVYCVLNPDKLRRIPTTLFVVT